MAKLITYFDDDSSLIDYAVALITGDAPTSISNAYTAGVLGAENNFQAFPLLETNIIPTNGNTNGRMLLGRDDDDVDIFIPVNGKAVEGNLFVAYRDSGEVNLGTNAEAVISAYLNDIRQICDDANVEFSSSFVVNGGNLQNNGELFVIAYGILKETQTDDYNPLDVISPTWNYRMIDSNVVESLYLEASE